MHLFRYEARSGNFGAASRGVNIHHIGATTLSEWPIPIPPRQEQRQIVEAIEEQLSRLDAAVVSLRAARSRLSILKRAVVNRALPDSGRELTLAEAIGTASRFVDGDWIETKDQNPEGDVRLIQLADIGDGVFRDRSSRFLTSATAARLKCTYLEPGDLLVARMPQPLGRCCEFPGATKPSITAVDVCIIRIAGNELHSKWLMHALNATKTRAQIASLQSGTTRKRISRKNLATVTLTVPTPQVQRRVAEDIDRKMSVVEVMVDEVDNALARAGRLRQRTLGEAFAGRLVPRDSSDPPTSSVRDKVRA